MQTHTPGIPSTTAVSRRAVLHAAAVTTAGLAGMLATNTPPAYAATRTLTMLTWNHETVVKTPGLSSPCLME